MTQRLFVAVVPPPAVRQELDDYLEPRRAADQRLRWVLAEAWHLTCAFLPKVQPQAVDLLTDGLAGVAERTEPFTIQLGGAGAFPHPDQAKVLWLGLSAGGPALESLAIRCRHAANRSGIAVDRGPFRPHLTIARAAGISATRWLGALAALPEPRWRVEGFSLIRSQSLPGGAGYQRLAEFRLTG